MGVVGRRTYLPPMTCRSFLKLILRLTQGNISLHQSLRILFKRRKIHTQMTLPTIGGVVFLLQQ